MLVRADGLCLFLELVNLQNEMVEEWGVNTSSLRSSSHRLWCKAIIRTSSFLQLLAAKMQQSRVKSTADILHFESLKSFSSDFLTSRSNIGLDRVINQS